MRLTPETHPALFSAITGEAIMPAQVARPPVQPRRPPKILDLDKLAADFGEITEVPPEEAKQVAAPQPAGNPPAEATPVPKPAPQRRDWQPDPKIESWALAALPRSMRGDGIPATKVRAWARSGDYSRLADFLSGEAYDRSLAEWPWWFPWIWSWVRETRAQHPWFNHLVTWMPSVSRPRRVAARLRESKDSPQAAELKNRFVELEARLRALARARGSGAIRLDKGQDLLLYHYDWMRERYEIGEFTADYARLANEELLNMVFPLTLFWSNQDVRELAQWEIDRYPVTAP